MDYYDILEVAPDASSDEIRAAYRKLARRYHPDLSTEPDAEERFMLINEAHNTLGDPDRRAEYDQQRTHTKREPAPRREEKPERGTNVIQQIRITLEEAAHGTTREVEFPRTVTCPLCAGMGTERGTAPMECPECAGTGQIQQKTGVLGRLTAPEPCSRCGGKGKIITRRCPECKGSGRVQRIRRTTVELPAGADTGTRITVEGEGEIGRRGGPHGNLTIIIQVEPHPIFKRHGPHIEVEIPITFTQAALGAEVDVLTLWGSQVLNIPPGTQTHTVFTLTGMGMPSGGKRGDQRVRIVIHTPTDLTEREEELLRELEQERNG